MYVTEFYLACAFYDVQMLTRDVKLRFVNLVTGAKHQLTSHGIYLRRFGEYPAYKCMNVATGVL